MSYLSADGFIFVRIFLNAHRIPLTETGRQGPLNSSGQILQGGAENMAKAGARIKITLRCNECKQRNYNTMKNKKNTPDRIEMQKYCRFCRKHTAHTETK